MLRPVLDVSVSYDGDAISLYNVWKVTNSRGTCAQGLRRLCNRLWRLLNEQVLGCCNRKLGPLHLALNNAPLAPKSRPRDRILPPQPPAQVQALALEQAGQPIQAEAAEAQTNLAKPALTQPIWFSSNRGDLNHPKTQPDLVDTDHVQVSPTQPDPAGDSYTKRGGAQANLTQPRSTQAGLVSISPTQSDQVGKAKQVGQQHPAHVQKAHMPGDLGDPRSTQTRPTQGGPTQNGQIQPVRAQRASLFLNTRPATHSSLSAATADLDDLGDDTSDISEDGEYDSDELLGDQPTRSRIVDYESSLGRDKNIFYIGPSPLPDGVGARALSRRRQATDRVPRLLTDQTFGQNLGQNSGQRSGHISTRSAINSSDRHRTGAADAQRRQSSVHDRIGSERSGSRGTSISGHGVAAGQASEAAVPVVAGVAVRHDSLFGADVKVTSNLSSLSSTDISDDEDEAAPSKAPSRMSKSATDDSEWMSISSDSEHITESPRTQPLTFAKVIPGRRDDTGGRSTEDRAALSDETRRASPVLKPRSLLSGLFLNEMAALPTHAPKPVLKRSSTTGVITIDKARTRDHRTKASILFSKRYASFSDISRKASLFRSPVLFVEEEEPGDVPDKSDSDSLLVKQTSSVGLSKFMANASIGEPRLVAAHRSPTHDALETNLSSSLSKYSSLYPSAGNSFKNILSKSSLNISTLFGLHKPKPKINSRSSENFRLPARAEPLPSLFEGYLSQQNSQDALEQEQVKTPSKSIKMNPMKSFEPSVEISASLKDSLMIDHKLGKIPLPERVISDDDLFHGKDRVDYLEDNDDYYSKGW